MRDSHYDVVGIGNAIVDIIARCDVELLAQQDVAKGHMQLVDSTRIAQLYDAIGPAIEMSGGSAANTIAGVASFGGRAGYIGKVSDDEFGRIFTHDIRAIGVEFSTPPATDSQPTARSLILVTPDGERTMNTFLGVSPELSVADLDADMISAGNILYLEGYLFDAPSAKQSFREAARIAKAADRRVALTLSDGFCVERHRDEFLDFIRNDVDVLFANEQEITSLYQSSSFDEAAALIKADTALCALTRSEKGSIIVSNEHSLIIPPYPVETVTDTTGAGDLYAAGFLYGYSNSLALDVCGKLGSLAAAEVISHLGARPERNLKDLATETRLL